MTPKKTKKRVPPPVIGFLGVGKMGGAILDALVGEGITSASSVRICDASAKRCLQLAIGYGVIPGTAEEVVAASDVVFLAVKPQDLGPLLEGLPRDAISRTLFISIAAGRRLGWLEARLPGARVVRAMPNLCVSIGIGMTAYSAGSRTLKKDLRLTEKLLSGTGKVMELPEAQMDAVTALSGSGPAFIASVAQAMIQGGAALGLEEETATELAVQTMLGTAAVLSVGADDIETFIRSVTSAGGTTAAGLAVLQKSAMAGTMKRTLEAAARRSRELSRLP